LIYTVARTASGGDLAAAWVASKGRDGRDALPPAHRENGFGRGRGAVVG